MARILKEFRECIINKHYDELSKRILLVLLDEDKITINDIINNLTINNEKKLKIDHENISKRIKEKLIILSNYNIISLDLENKIKLNTFNLDIQFNIAKYIKTSEELFSHLHGEIIIKTLAKNGLMNEEEIYKNYLNFIKNKKTINNEKKDTFDEEEINNFLNELNEDKNIIMNDNNKKKSLSMENNLIKQDFNKILNEILLKGYIEPIKIKIKEKNEIVYRMNLKRFQTEIINKKIVNYIVTQTDGICGSIVQSMLDINSLNIKNNSNKNICKPITSTKIYSLLSKNKNNRYKSAATLRKSKINALLTELSLPDKTPFLIKPDNNLNSYSVNINGILTEIKRQTLVTAIKQKFGIYAARIFALLSKTKYLEDQFISDFTLLPRNEVRVCLYNMLDWGLVHLKEIPINYNEPTSNKIFYMWSVPLESVFKEFLCETLIKSWINLLEREAKEEQTKKENEIYENSNEGNNKNNSENILKRLNSIRLAQLRIEEQICIFMNEQ